MMWTSWTQLRILSNNYKCRQAKTSRRPVEEVVALGARTSVYRLEYSQLMSTCGGRSSPVESVWAAQMSELRSPQQPTLTGSRSWALIPDSMSSESCEHTPQHQPAFCCHFFQNTEWSSGWGEHVIQSRVCRTPLPQSNRLAESLRL